MEEIKREKKSSEDFKIKEHSLEVLSCGYMKFNICGMMTWHDVARVKKMRTKTLQLFVSDNNKSKKEMDWKNWKDWKLIQLKGCGL